MRCLVVGGSGQDGILLSAQLLAQGNRVVSISRRPSPLAAAEHYCIDVIDSYEVDRLIKDIRPNQVYYLSAHHRSSEDRRPPLHQDLAESLAVNTQAFARLLEVVSTTAPEARVVYASSCRVFGLGDGSLLNESSPRQPACAYGISKTAGMAIADLFRRERALFVSTAILFNHESELRGDTFLSKRLATAALAARSNPSIHIHVESLDAVADWGSARDYTTAMMRIASAATADDFVVASGRLRTVGDLAKATFAAVGLDWRRHVTTSADDASRPRWRLVGDSTKLTSRTGWRASSDFDAMVRDLVTRMERHGSERPADFHSYL